MKSLSGEDDLSDVPVKTRRAHIRNPNFSSAATATLRSWLHAHARNPYPTKLQKRSLMRKTGLSAKQLNIWMTNARKVLRTPNKAVLLINFSAYFSLVGNLSASICERIGQMFPPRILAPTATRRRSRGCK